MSDQTVGQSPELKSINRVLVVLVLLAVCWTTFGTSVNVSRFGEVLQRLSQMKIPVPGLPLLLLEHQGAFLLIVHVIAATCAWATYRRPDRRSTTYLNVGGIIVLMSWWVLHTTVLYAVTATVIQISIPRNP